MLSQFGLPGASPSLLWSLSSAHYNSRLRVVATKHGLDPDRVHSHSVRIGGATQVPDYVIMAMVGWASVVYLQYVRPSFQLYEAAQAALANAGYITAQSIRAIPSLHCKITFRLICWPKFSSIICFNSDPLSLNKVSFETKKRRRSKQNNIYTFAP